MSWRVRKSFDIEFGAVRDEFGTSDGARIASISDRESRSLRVQSS
jgi:hypothetical protein